jgi:hypothetical protein
MSKQKKEDKKMGNKLKNISDACEQLFNGMVDDDGTVSVAVMQAATKHLQSETRYQAMRLKYREVRGEFPEIEELS